MSDEAPGSPAPRVRYIGNGFTFDPGEGLPVPPDFTFVDGLWTAPMPPVEGSPPHWTLIDGVWTAPLVPDEPPGPEA